MLFSGKENVFMCLVAFQNIFRKIFSGVWKRRRKRQNPEKPRHTQKNTVRSRDQRRDLAKCQSRTVLRARSCCAISRSFSLSFSLCTSLVPEIIWSENRNGNEFRGQCYYFTVNWKWFPENSIFQTNQTAYFTENDFLKPFSPKTYTA